MLAEGLDVFPEFKHDLIGFRADLEQVLGAADQVEPILDGEGRDARALNEQVVGMGRPWAGPGRDQVGVLVSDQGEGKIALGIVVDHQDAVAAPGQGFPEIDAHRGLPDASLLIGDGDDASHTILSSSHRISVVTADPGSTHHWRIGWPASPCVREKSS